MLNGSCGEGCGGKIGRETIDLATKAGVSFRKPEGETANVVEACIVCGRLHWSVSGEAVFAEDGKKAFLYKGQVALF